MYVYVYIYIYNYIYIYVYIYIYTHCGESRRAVPTTNRREDEGTNPPLKHIYICTCVYLSLSIYI